jgi:hypothetical protein
VTARERPEVLRARLAALDSWAQTPDRAARTAPARAGLLARFEREVDPDGVLLPAERAKRAESARRAFYARLALASAAARRRRAGR